MTRDPIGYKGGINLYGFAGNNPVNNADPSGMDWLDTASNFSAGWGDTLTFGGTKWGRKWAGEAIHAGDANAGIDYTSGSYHAGEIAGTVNTTLMDGAGLAKFGASGALRIGMRRPLPGMAFGKLRNVEVVEKSHWIADRVLPRGLQGTGNRLMQWNLKKMWSTDHALSDPHRYKFMPRWWKAQNPMPHPGIQQWNRIPDPIKGGAVGFAHGAGYAAYSNSQH